IDWQDLGTIGDPGDCYGIDPSCETGYRVYNNMCKAGTDCAVNMFNIIKKDDNYNTELNCWGNYDCIDGLVFHNGECVSDGGSVIAIKPPPDKERR
ncbi:MAG: hypothetical protein JJV93_02000, partial [Alphaproteobacteria bacterium]|nr:hypothetical protein [Alphaproteobacteria bacterium]